MKIISGGQSGVDRAALDAAIERGLAYGGWCPSGGWAEDFPHPPGLLEKYPHLAETPLADPAQRTAWNVRDTDAALIIVDAGSLAVSQGTMLARELAQKYRKPLLVVDVSAPDSIARAAAWLRTLLDARGPGLTLGIGGPRESEAPGIYARAKVVVGAILDSCRREDRA
jgi:putative molybdenum carrier protein